MRKATLLCSLVMLVLAVATTAQAALATTQFFANSTNRGTGVSGQYFINLAGSSPTHVDVGDVFVGSVNFLQIEDISGGKGTNAFGTGGVDQLTALFAIKATSHPDSQTFTWGPVTATDLAAASSTQMSASLKGYLGTWQPGTMIAVYSNPNTAAADRYTRVFNAAHPLPDDGDAGRTGADIGNGPFTSEESLISTAHDFLGSLSDTKLLELGFTGAVGPDGAPLPGSGEGWITIATLGVNAEDVKALRQAPDPAGAGSANFALDPTANLTGLNYALLQSIFNGYARFIGSALITGVGSATTPFDTMPNNNVTFAPVPEPMSLLVWSGLGLVGLLAYRRSRR